MTLKMQEGVNDGAELPISESPDNISQTFATSHTEVEVRCFTTSPMLKLPSMSSLPCLLSLCSGTSY